MSDDLDSADGLAGRHLAARQLAEQALRAQSAGNQDEADRLFADAERIDPQAVAAVLEQQRGEQDNGVSGDTTPQNDEEIAALSRTIEPGSAPSRAGVSGRGSGGDNQGT